MICEMLTGKLLYLYISMAKNVVAVIHNGMRPTLNDLVPESLRYAKIREISKQDCQVVQTFHRIRIRYQCFHFSGYIGLVTRKLFIFIIYK